MHYRFLSELGDHYNAEEGTEGVRRAALNQLLGKLTAAKVNLESKLTAARPSAPSGPVNVKQLGAFFQQTATRSNKSQAELDTPEIVAARGAVARARRWLELQGIVLDRNDQIDWSKSSRAVVYDRDANARGMTSVKFRGTLMYSDDAGTKPIDTRNMVTHFSGPGYAIYVMSDTGSIHVSSHSVGYRHHSSLLAGEDVAGAGEMQIDKGKLVWISNKSGHYQPDAVHFLQVLHQLQKKGVDLSLSKVKYLSASGPSDYANVGLYLAEMERNDISYYLGKMLQYLRKIPWPEFEGLITPKGWRWRNAIEQGLGQPNGVYTIVGGTYVPPKTITHWLKSVGKTADLKVQAGTGR